MPLVLLLAGLATFVAIGVAGASVIERYLAVPALALMVFAAVAIGGWTMLLPSRIRTAWMIGATVIVLAGVAFTATRLNLSRFDNELRFRGQAHADLTEVLYDPRVKAGLQLRAADRARTTRSSRTRAGSPASATARCSRAPRATATTATCRCRTRAWRSW